MNHYENAKFIAIKRDVIDVINSTFRMKEEVAFKEVFNYVNYNKSIDKNVKNSNRGIIVSFKDLKESKEESIKQKINQS